MVSFEPLIHSPLAANGNKKKTAKVKGTRSEPAVLSDHFPRAVMIASATFFGASV